MKKYYKIKVTIKIFCLWAGILISRNLSYYLSLPHGTIRTMEFKQGKADALGEMALAIAKTGDIKRALSVAEKITGLYIRNNTFEDLL